VRRLRVEPLHKRIVPPFPNYIRLHYTAPAPTRAIGSAKVHPSSAFGALIHDLSSGRGQKEGNWGVGAFVLSSMRNWKDEHD
jgi:hypothetical protein